MFPGTDASQRSQNQRAYMNDVMSATKMDITLDDIKGYVRQSYRDAEANQTTLLSNRVDSEQ